MIYECHKLSTKYFQCVPFFHIYYQSATQKLILLPLDFKIEHFRRGISFVACMAPPPSFDPRFMSMYFSFFAMPPHSRCWWWILTAPSPQVDGRCRGRLPDRRGTHRRGEMIARQTIASKRKDKSHNAVYKYAVLHAIGNNAWIWIDYNEIHEYNEFVTPKTDLTEFATFNPSPPRRYPGPLSGDGYPGPRPTGFGPPRGVLQSTRGRYPPPLSPAPGVQLYLSDISTAANRARTLVPNMVAFSVGGLVGPAIGGCALMINVHASGGILGVNFKALRRLFFSGNIFIRCFSKKICKAVFWFEYFPKINIIYIVRNITSLPRKKNLLRMAIYWFSSSQLDFCVDVSKGQIQFKW